MDLTFRYTSRVYLLFGRANGYFEPPRLAIQELASIMAVADFTGDGRSDLILGDNTGQLPIGVATLLQGRSDGNLDRATVELPIGQLVEADLDRDGKADLAGAFYAGHSNVVVSLNNGDGSFGPVTEYQIGLQVNYVNVLAGDVDADGVLDLVRISDARAGTVGSGPGVLFQYTNTVSVLMNNGDGTFRIGPSGYAGLSIMNNAAVADFNGDGKADLVCSHHYDFDPSIPQDSAAVLLGNGDGTFGDPVLWQMRTRVYGLFVADFNADGAVDLGIYNSAGTVVLSLGHGDGTFLSPEYGPLTNLRFGTSMVVGDFNGDNQPDLACANESGIEVYLNACHPPPEPPNGLAIQRRGQTAFLSWPMDPSGSLLESTTSGSISGWSPITGELSTNQNRLELQTPIEGAQRYFRLREPGP